MESEQANLFTVLSERLKHYMDRGEIDRARTIAQTAVRAARRSSLTKEENLPQFVEALRQLASLRMGEGHWAEAETSYREALNFARKNEFVTAPQKARLLCDLVTALEQQGKSDLAVPFYQEAIELLEDGEEKLTVAHLRNNLGLIYRDQGRLEAAEAQYLRSLFAFEDQLGTPSEQVAALYNNIGGLYQASGHYERALDMQLKALEIRRALQGGDNAELAQSLSNVASAYHALERWEDAEAHYREAIAMKAEIASSDWATFEIISTNYAELLRFRGKEETATKIEEELKAHAREDTGAASCLK